MSKSATLVRPGFLLAVLVVLTMFCLGVLNGVPTEKEKTQAKIVTTHVEERCMAELLGQEIIKDGGLTNVPKQLVSNPFLVTNTYAGISFTTRINTSGELLDRWQRPFQIKAVGPTNFLICSAGPNQKYGDTDDIIFNSLSNNLVKP